MYVFTIFVSLHFVLTTPYLDHLRRSVDIYRNGRAGGAEKKKKRKNTVSVAKTKKLNLSSSLIGRDRCHQNHEIAIVSSMKTL